MKPEEAKYYVLNNQTIGRNLATFRKLRDKKAWEISEYIGLKEASYTKYERGESKITVELIQKVADCLKVDPIRIIITQPEKYVESINNPLPPLHTDAIFTISETLMQIHKVLKKMGS